MRTVSQSSSSASAPPMNLAAAVTPREDGAYMSVQTPRVGSSALADDLVVFETTATYDLRVDRAQYDRAVELKPMSVARPHMRSFHVSWVTGITGFIGWYAIPPLMPVIKEQLGLTNGQILNSDIAATASTIISRVLVGPLLELFGPQHVHSFTLWLGAIPIAAAAFVQSSVGLLIVRFFIGLVGCIFVSSQFWTTITFARNVVGTSNAISGGLGLSGIGFAFLILPYVNAWLTHAVSVDLAWRLSIALPAVVMVVMGTVSWFRADSCPMGEFHHLRRAQLAASAAAQTEEGDGAATPPPQELKIDLRQTLRNLGRAFRVVLSDRNTYILVLHYGMSFGAELQLNNMGALYFYEEFPKRGCVMPEGAKDDGACSTLSKAHAATVASAFGLMNMFARALGGLASDFANNRHGIRGRQYVQFALLCLCGALVIVLSRMTELGPSVAVYVLVAIAAQSAGGSCFGLVPYVNDAYTGTVTGLVGAGGNLGGVLFGIIFRASAARSDGLLVMGCIILASAFSTAFISLREDKIR